MLCEGKGYVAPNPEDVRLTVGEVRYYEALAKAREQARRYAHSSRRWSNGLIQRPTLVGLVAEHVYAKFMNHHLGLSLTVDEADRPGGDGGVDFSPASVPVQVKGRNRRGDLLIRRETEDGRLVEFPWQVCVVVTWRDNGEGHLPELVATVDGWVTRATVLEGRFCSARVGDHMNLELSDRRLECPSSLVQFFRNRMEGRS